MTRKAMKKGGAALVASLALGLAAFGAAAQTQLGPTGGPPAGTVSEHVKKDIERHRAMAAAHEAAARCLSSGRTEADCQKELQAACRGLAIGKYCGMRHEH